MKHCNIPDVWTGEEALAFVALLDQLTCAIWRAHGEKMAHCLQQRDAHSGDLRPPHDAAAPGDDFVFAYEPIPFPGGGA